MKNNRSEKLRLLQEILANLTEQELDALILLLDKQPLNGYGFTEKEISMVAERFYAYETRQTGGISAAESIRRLDAHLENVKSKNKK